MIAFFDFPPNVFLLQPFHSSSALDTFIPKILLCLCLSFLRQEALSMGGALSQVEAQGRERSPLE